MAKEVMSVDDTHMRNTVNVSQLKRASGDSASGVDSATLNAVSAQMAVDGVMNMMAMPPVLDPTTQSNIASDKITSVSASKKLDQRADKINELALGLQGRSGGPDKVNSLGDMMCELMLVMIQSTSERRKMEREMRTLLVTANVDTSKEIAQDILEKSKHDVNQMKMDAWMSFANTVANSVVDFGVTFQSTKMKKEGGEWKTFEQINKSLDNSAIKTVLQIGGSVAQGALGIVKANGAKKSSNSEADITQKQAAIKLTRFIAGSIEQSLQSIDNARESLFSMLSQISQAGHDNKMQIIRNSAI